MGCHITRDNGKRQVRIDYFFLFCETLGNRYGIDKESALPSLVDRHFFLSKEDSPQSPEDHLEMKDIMVRPGVGKLMSAATIIRPENVSALQPAVFFF